MGRSCTGRDYAGCNHTGHTYTGLTYAGLYCICAGHSYAGHKYLGHTHTGQGEYAVGTRGIILRGHKISLSHFTVTSSSSPPRRTSRSRPPLRQTAMHPARAPTGAELKEASPQQRKAQGGVDRGGTAAARALGALHVPCHAMARAGVWQGGACTATTTRTEAPCGPTRRYTQGCPHYMALEEAQSDGQAANARARRARARGARSAGSIYV